MHFSHIQLRNWKNFADGTTPLEQRVFLIGPNAAGKSNLLAGAVMSDPLAVESEMAD